MIYLNLLIHGINKATEDFKKYKLAVADEGYQRPD